MRREWVPFQGKKSCRKTGGILQRSFSSCQNPVGSVLFQFNYCKGKLKHMFFIFLHLSCSNPVSCSFTCVMQEKSDFVAKNLCRTFCRTFLPRLDMLNFSGTESGLQYYCMYSTNNCHVLRYQHASSEVGTNHAILTVPGL